MYGSLTCIWTTYLAGEVNSSYNGGVKLEGRIVQFLLVADDFMLVTETNEDAERN